MPSITLNPSAVVTANIGFFDGENFKVTVDANGIADDLILTISSKEEGGGGPDEYIYQFVFVNGELNMSPADVSSLEEGNAYSYNIWSWDGSELIVRVKGRVSVLKSIRPANLPAPGVTEYDGGSSTTDFTGATILDGGAADTDYTGAIIIGEAA